MSCFKTRLDEINTTKLKINLAGNIKPLIFVKIKSKLYAYSI